MPPNYDMDITVDKDNLTVFNLRSRASEAVIPWNQLSSVAICVDGAKQAKYWHICRTDKSFVDVPLSIPSQEKFSKRLDRLPGFHMAVAAQALLAPLDPAQKQPEWYWVYVNWNAYFKRRQGEAEATRAQQKTQQAASDGVAPAGDTSKSPPKASKKGTKASAAADGGKGAAKRGRPAKKKDAIATAVPAATVAAEPKP
jgi:hypothetical protein